MSLIVNIAAYRFADLSGLSELRFELKELTQQLGLRGTILLSAEGINLFVAGSRESVDALLQRVRLIPGLEDIEAKESLSDEQPFNRMLVKIKKEIIAFGIPEISPARSTAKRISADDLKAWLDAGEPVTLLDTRNDYEVRVGTFRNATVIGIDDFREFPEAAKDLPVELRKSPVVTFCTGGIRCEKAAAYLEREGFLDVYQLDGGILKYFEQCGGAHYDGHCFVFDKRVAVDATLAESDFKRCYRCQAVLTPEDFASAKYVEGRSCPACYQTVDEAREALIQKRNAKIQHLLSPLPGSLPGVVPRPLRVPASFEGKTLLDALEGMHPQLSSEEWRLEVAARRVTRDGRPLDVEDIVSSGDRLLHTTPAAIEPDVAIDVRVLYEDDAIIVVDKPAPLPVYPVGPFHRNTLSWFLNRAYAPLKPRVVSPLDCQDSGLVIFAKTRTVERIFAPQFERGDVVTCSPSGSQGDNRTVSAITFRHPVTGRLMTFHAS